MSLPKTWSLIVLLPLLPVVLLYILFERQNYFELHDTAKGLVATGPIAAYVVIVWIAYRIYFKISPSFVGFDERLDQLCDKWTFVSTSRGGHVRQGDCTITKDRQQLVINGNFKEGETILGIWEGELTGLRGNNFLMVYSLQETGKPNFYGLVQVPFGDPAAQQMSGIWSVVGELNIEGNITYTRKAR